MLFRSATIAGLFPAVAMKLLGFVALYGFILAPIGAVIFFEHYFSKRFRIESFFAEKAGIGFNMAVFLAWIISIGFYYFISENYDVFLSFLTFPAWVTCGVLFLLLSRFYQKKYQKSFTDKSES